MRCFAVLLVLCSLVSCRVFRAAEWSRRDRCAERLPVLRTEPARPYRVLKIIKAGDDDRLAWLACAEGGDAVISTMSESAHTESSARAGFLRVSSSSTTERVAFMEGVVIRYTD